MRFVGGSDTFFLPPAFFVTDFAVLAVLLAPRFLLAPAAPAADLVLRPTLAFFFAVPTDFRFAAFALLATDAPYWPR
ncbi:hypothetical protein V1278_005128 [Bradyrhizobium sp. AZCC 1577]